MNYLVFPFGKYKGVDLHKLPSTYIVLALEKFELPNELNSELLRILLGRVGYYSSIKEQIEKKGIDIFLNSLQERIDIYEY